MWLLAAAAAAASIACRPGAGRSLEDHLSDALLAGSETRCGTSALLRGDGIRLAASLDAAILRVRPVRLTPAAGRWILDQGWEDAKVAGGLRIGGDRASIRLPAPACSDDAPSSSPLLLALSHAALPDGSRPGARVRASLAQGSRAEARIGRETPWAVLDLGPAAWREGDLLDLGVDPAGAAALEGIALPLGRLRIEIDHEYRDGIAASSVREAAFRIAPPPSAALRFAIAVDRSGSAPPAAARGAGARDGAWLFRITVTDDRGAREIFREKRRGGESRSSWAERMVDLSAWAGSEVTLTLAAEPEGDPPPLALWGSPIIESTDRGLAGAARPNLLLISVDALRADRLGRILAGAPVTPSLDRLASEGTRFTQARTQAPSTLYGHAAILTGLPPAAHGATTLSALPEEIPYLPDLLARAGYATIAVTDDGLLDGRFGFSRGFDLFRNRFEPVEAKVDAALAILGATHGPWFLFLHTYEVHLPYEPPAETARTLSAGYAGPIGLGIDVRTILRINNAVQPVTPEDVRRIESLYDAEVLHTDAALGRFFQVLRERGLWERTIVVVTSDHGEEMDEHGVIGWHSLTCYEEVQRVPLIIKPARTGSSPAPPSAIVGAAVRSIDIAPTILDLAGLAAPEPIWGATLAGLMEGAAEPDRESLCEIEDGRGAAIAAGGWKYLMRTAESAADPRTFRRRVALHGRYPAEELYDLRGDPGERRNLASSDPDRARTLRALLESRLQEARDRLAALTRGRTPPPRPREDDEHLRRLRALGYVQ